MKRIRWKYSEEELALINTKYAKNRLYFALQLKYYETHLEFFTAKSQLSSKVVAKVASLLNVSANFTVSEKKSYVLYRKEIREYCDSKVIGKADEKRISDWLTVDVLPHEALTIEQLKEKVFTFLKSHKIDSYSEQSLERVVRSIKHRYEESIFNNIATHLDAETKAYLDGLLLVDDNASRFSKIKRWPGGLCLKTILSEAEKLKFIQSLSLPECITILPNKTLMKYYRNICTKYPSTIKLMPEARRYAFLSVFVLIRERQITDNLVELLIRLIKKFITAGKNKLQRELSTIVEIKRGCSQKTLLKMLAVTILGNENSIIKEAIYPVISKDRLEAIKEDGKDIQQTYEHLVHNRSRSSYVHHYRRMLAPVLEILNFNSNNERYQPIVEALDFIKAQLQSQTTFYSEVACIPIDGAVKKSHQDIVMNRSDKGERINRINYEMCVLSNLRSKLRVKEVWVKGAYHYRNPEEDLPQDFDDKREYYYNVLNKPLSAKRFIKKIQLALTKHLTMFNADIPKNSTVKLLKKPSGHIKLTPLKEQELPPQLESIKQEVFKRWPNTSLLDVLKETDIFVDFLSKFTASGPKVGLDEETLKTRLLLAIVGYGTNTGLKSMSAGNEDVTYQDLQHIKLRYFDPDNLRMAIRNVINQLFKIRMPEIWEQCTTAVASDSTHVKATDQNLMSQFHPRYRSSGVMIYWHVDTKSVCIYSQLKSCSSSEVSSMIEGVLRHCTDMDVEKNYVDTHGASEVGFAFSYMLDFELLPRFKNIHKQKLYVTHKDDASSYGNISSILSRHIKWDLIEKQYDQIVKYTTALKLGTAHSETIMKRFTRDNLQHPTYKALSELGKAIKTIFLCRYLSSAELRREIHEGLNVVERWNGINDFIFYGNARTLRSKKPEELEISMLCLHLLQISMVFINTLMLQQVLQESDWISKMTLEDKRAITPLLCEHINPYGVFVLDLKKRLAINDPFIPLQKVV